MGESDLIERSGDPQTMPLEVFIAAKIKGLATDASELFVDADSSLRACLYPWVRYAFARSSHPE
ncbi:hypothetical protein [Achromobacter piechaudii]|uniref:Uncharacterized protein n=1 Tax=Achromobacter piechaudii ATCC 43553 TaxID=742159 RepID=D4XJ14_9BURK|nr:hypothetical protein [Achromobacter piechaudii]EFF73131.1 hypothetical protein HMPREF0004_5461 [Achromobacter piechaudii ATCC 43553]